MNDDIPWSILEKQFLGNANASDLLLIQQWKNSASENNLIYNQLDQYYKSTGTLPIDFNPDTIAALNTVSSQIFVGPEKKYFTIATWLWKVAAIIILTIGGWLAFHINHHLVKTELAFITTTDSAQSNIVLSDGSHISLNRGSSIRYPLKFENTREVYLEGEAYFEIAHDSKHPFIVHAANTQTRVLGTKFDIRTHSNESQITVVLNEGKVCFADSLQHQTILLPGQKAVYNKLTYCLERIVNTDINFLAWKTHDFTFDAKSIETIFKSLADVYGFRYTFSNPAIKTRLLTTTFKHRPLPEIMQTISTAAEVNISIVNGVYCIQ